jgi:hypothetical protein
VLGSLLNRRSGLSIRNGVLLYKQFIRPMMDYACPIWRCVARNYVKHLQALQSKCLRIATGAPWYISNRQIPKDLGVPFFEEHTRALTESYDSKLAGVGNPLIRQLCMQNRGQFDIETCSLLTSWAHFSHRDSGDGPRNPPSPAPAGTAASSKCPLRIHYAICQPGFNSQAVIQPKFPPSDRKSMCSLQP